MKLFVDGVVAALVIVLGSGCLGRIDNPDGGIYNPFGPGNGDGGSPDGGGAPDGGASCDHLDETQCHERTDCIADVCNSCTCGSGFAGCRSQNEPPHACPAIACPQLQCCHDTNDCGDGKLCRLPITNPRPCGGACFIGIDTCASDSECNAQDPTMICGPLPCNCGGPANHCTPGCSDDNPCPDGQVCGDTHRCAPRFCDVATPCPTDFACSASFACERQSCGHDADCASSGFCVEGQCFRSAGVCEFPVPLPQ